MFTALVLAGNLFKMFSENYAPLRVRRIKVIYRFVER